MPRKKSIESRVESALDKQLAIIDTLEPAVRANIIKLGIQWVMVQHKIKDAGGYGTEFMSDEEKSDD